MSTEREGIWRGAFRTYDGKLQSGMIVGHISTDVWEALDAPTRRQLLAIDDCEAGRFDIAELGVRLADIEKERKAAEQLSRAVIYDACYLSPEERERADRFDDDTIRRTYLHAESRMHFLDLLAGLEARTPTG